MNDTDLSTIRAGVAVARRVLGYAITEVRTVLAGGDNEQEEEDGATRPH